MANAVKIAVVQQEVKPGQVEDNRRRALDHARQALDKGADIILFPEEMLIGYCPDIAALAEPVDGPTSQAFAELLAGTGSLVLWGLTEKKGSDLFIAATLVGAGGVLANYRKTHLWWADEGLRCEAATYKPGEKLVTFDVKGHKSGAMICYDGDFPETARSYADLDCRMLFWMNNRGSRGHAEVTHLAMTNSLIMATSCPCGLDEAGRTCRGGSNITGMYGDLLAEIWDAEGIIYAEVDPSAVPAQRGKNPWFLGRRPDLYVRPKREAVAAPACKPAPAAVPAKPAAKAAKPAAAPAEKPAAAEKVAASASPAEPAAPAVAPPRAETPADKRPLNIWVQKTRLHLKKGGPGSHVKDYLQAAKADEPFLSGGRGSTGNPDSMACIKAIQPCDMIVLFQVDDESIYGFAQAASAGFESDRGSGRYDSVQFRPPATAFRFPEPVRVAKLQKAGFEAACFGPGTRGRMFAMSIEEFVSFARALKKVDPNAAKLLSAWLPRPA